MRVRRRAYLHRSSDVSSASRSVQEANRLQSGRRERPTAAVASQAHRGSQRRKRTVAQVRCQGWQWRLDDLLGYAKPSTVESLLSMVESLLRLMVESWLLTELAAHTPAALVHLAAPRTSLAISLLLDIRSKSLSLLKYFQQLALVSAHDGFTGNEFVFDGRPGGPNGSALQHGVSSLLSFTRLINSWRRVHLLPRLINSWRQERLLGGRW